jgi:hypothetical protein
VSVAARRSKSTGTTIYATWVVVLVVCVAVWAVILYVAFGIIV